MKLPAIFNNSLKCEQLSPWNWLPSSRPALEELPTSSSSTSFFQEQSPTPTTPSLYPYISIIIRNRDITHRVIIHHSLESVLDIFLVSFLCNSWTRKSWSWTSSKFESKSGTKVVKISTNFSYKFFSHFIIHLSK